LSVGRLSVKVKPNEALHRLFHHLAHLMKLLQRLFCGECFRGACIVQKENNFKNERKIRKFKTNKNVKWIRVRHIKRQRKIIIVKT
jgi:hypothetical protein